jgi:hypothetical protein
LWFKQVFRLIFALEKEYSVIGIIFNE